MAWYFDPLGTTVTTWLPKPVRSYSSLHCSSNHGELSCVSNDNSGTQIWMNHSSKNGDRTSSLLSTQPHKAASVPTSPAAASTAFTSQSALSASDAILNVGQLRKEVPARATSVQSHGGDALLQAFSELPQQHSLKVNTAQLAAPTHARSVDSGSRAASPFWLQQRSAPSPVPSQVSICMQHSCIANVPSTPDCVKH